MKVLFLSTDEKEADLVRDFMLDSMWSQVTIKYSDSNYLLLEDGTKIEDPTQIIQALKPQKLSTKMQTASKAAKKAFEQFKKEGFVKTSPEITEQRRTICLSCPFSKQKLFTQICDKCGCHIKTKTLLLTESCPLNKW